MKGVLLDPVLLTQTLIRSPSITPQEAGALDFLQKHLSSLGFTCSRVKFQEDSASLPVDNLYARLGKSSPHLCFAGHIDVVPPGELHLWRHPPFEGVIEEGILYGRGAVDMKGSIGCFLTAVSRFLNFSSFSGSLSFLLTSDEEGPALHGTRKMVEWLQEKGEKIDAFLVGEPTSQETIGDTVKIGRRGSLNVYLSVEGKQGHTAYPHLAENPIPPLLACLQTLLKGLQEEISQIFPPTHLEITSLDVANPVCNIIPHRAQARFNIRFNEQHTSSSLKKWIQGACEAHLKKYTLEFSTPSEPYLTLPGPLTELIQEVIQAKLSLKPQLSTSGGTSDGRFLCKLAPVIELGLLGKTLHQINEQVPLKDLETLTNLYENFLRKFFKA